MTVVHRERVFSCPRDGTFKYYLPKDQTQPAWQRMVEAFGPPRVGAAGVVTLETPSFTLRAPSWGNPMTLIRKRGWRESDLRLFHELIGFLGDGRE